MAMDLDMSVGAYRKIEMNQTNKDNSTGYLQQIENFHQENKEQSQKIETLYEARLLDKDIFIKQLQEIIAKK
jgi:hypothetical protein